MNLFKLSVLSLLCAAMLFGCVALPPVTTTRPDPTDPTTTPGTTAAPTDPTQSTTVPPVTTVPPETTTPTTVPPTEPPVTTAPPTVPPETTVPPTEPKPTECSHTYKTETVAATCTTAGKETKTCTRCGQQQTKTLAALGHAYGAGTVITPAATCADMGSIRYSCSRCGHSYETAYRGNHRFGETYWKSPRGYRQDCQDCGYQITDIYTYHEEDFSNCDKNAALYTDTIRLKEPAYTGKMSQWSETWLAWYDLLMNVLKTQGEGGVVMELSISYETYGGTEEATMAEFNRFLDAFQSVYGWRPVWIDAFKSDTDILLCFETSSLMPLYKKATDNMSAAQRDALIQDLVAFHIHRMGLRSGMQTYNSVGVIGEYFRFKLLHYDYLYGYNSAFRGLTCGSTRCLGYSEIFQLFAEYCGIRSEIVIGTLDGEGHAWNRVIFSDGTVRYVDSTNLNVDYLILVPWDYMAHFDFKMN